jgi:hypothetical protein
MHSVDIINEISFTAITFFTHSVPSFAKSEFFFIMIGVVAFGGVQLGSIKWVVEGIIIKRCTALLCVT